MVFEIIEISLFLRVYFWFNIGLQVYRGYEPYVALWTPNTENKVNLEFILGIFADRKYTGDTNHMALWTPNTENKVKLEFILDILAIVYSFFCNTAFRFEDLKDVFGLFLCYRKKPILRVYNYRQSSV